MISAIKYSCIFILFPAFLFSQSFSTEGNEWVQNGENLVGDRYPVYVELQGDTIINGKVYSSAYFHDEVFTPVPEYIGAIREENDSVHVIPANADSPEELLIYDWTVIVGDTLQKDEFSWVVVEDIIITNLLDGEERKQFDCGHYRIQFNTDTIRSPLTIIEGVGCTDYGFLFNPLFQLPLTTFQLSSGPEDIRCYSNSNELLWQNEEVIDCDSIIVATEHIVSDHTFSIVPNPVVDRLKITFPQELTGSFELSIFDLRGRIMKNATKYLTYETLEMSVSELPSGFYFLQLWDGSQKYITRFLKI